MFPVCAILQAESERSYQGNGKKHTGETGAGIKADIRLEGV